MGNSGTIGITNWSPWRIARVITSLIVVMVASYYLVVGFDNVTNPTNPNGSNWPFVTGVLSGDGVPADSGFGWRFIDASWFAGVAYVGIIATEILTGVVLLIGAVKGLRTSARRDAWDRAQKWTFAGGFLGLLLYFFGFIVVGGNWFIMYLNSKYNGLDPAFQNSVIVLAMVIFTALVMIGGRFEDDGPSVSP